MRYLSEDETSQTSAIPRKPSDEPSAEAKKVRFNLALNKEQEVERVIDMDSQLIDAIWYNKEEYSAIKKEISPILKMLMKGRRVIENDAQSARGLEFRTRQGSFERQQNKSTSVGAVLLEQWRQRDAGLNDPSRLAKLYTLASAHCQCRAHSLGRADEAAAKKLSKRR